MVLDLADAAFWRDPHPVLAAARAEHPIAVGPAGDVMVLGHPEVERVLRDPRMVTVDLLVSSGIVDGPLHDWWAQVMFSTDPPHHTRLRRLVSRAFTPKAVEQLRPAIVGITDELLDAMAPDDTAELVGAFAHELPIRVMSRLLAVPAEEHEVFGRWTADLGLVFSPVVAPELRAHLERTIAELTAYVEDLIRRRRADPGPDLLSALIAVEDGGDRLSADELVAMVENLLFAGHDTTRSLLMIGAHLLLEHPDVRASLVEDPGRAAAVVEEILRFEPPVLGTARRVTDDIELAGVALPAGTALSTNLLAANRDPRVFGHPDRFDVTRDASRHLAFGHGIHHCLGAALARAEAQSALARLCARFPRMELAAAPAWTPYASIRRFSSLEVRLR